MTDEHLSEAYEDSVLEHAERPRNRGRAANPTHLASRRNPLCGDEVTVTLRVEDGRLAEVRWEGRGCVISRAAASICCERLSGMTVEEIDALTNPAVLEWIGVPLSPQRRVCALLPAAAVRAALRLDGG